MPTETQGACVNATQVLLEMDLFVGKMKYTFNLEKALFVLFFLRIRMGIQMKTLDVQTIDARRITVPKNQIQVL